MKVLNYVYYDMESGDLRWLPRDRGDFASAAQWKRWTTLYADQPVGSARTGAVQLFFEGVSYQASHLVYHIVNGEPLPAGWVITYKDGNSMNLKYNNLQPGPRGGKSRRTRDGVQSKALEIVVRSQTKNQGDGPDGRRDRGPGGSVLGEGRPADSDSNWRKRDCVPTVTESKMRKSLEEKYDLLLFADGYDEAILGVDQEERVVYDADKIIEILMTDMMDIDGAREFFDFNVAGAYVGEKTPVYVWTKH